MKKALLIGIAAVLGLGVLAVGARAARTGCNWHAGWQCTTRRNFMAQHLIRELNLTSDQRASIKAILEKEKPTIQSIMTELGQQEAQLRSKSTFDEAFVRTVAQQRNATLTNALVEKEKVRAQIFEVLTPDQQQKVNQLGEEMRSAIQERITTLGDEL